MTELKPELKAQIEKEYLNISNRLHDRTDYASGYKRGIEDGYESGASAYALKWQQAEEENTRLLKVINNSLETCEAAIEKLGKADEMMEKMRSALFEGSHALDELADEDHRQNAKGIVEMCLALYNDYKLKQDDTTHR